MTVMVAFIYLTAQMSFAMKGHHTNTNSYS